MSKNKHKFDLTTLVKNGLIEEDETLYYVSDPKLSCTIVKIHGHEYKLKIKEEILTVHAVCQKFLGAEPPDHASRWLRNSKGKTLYEIWQENLELEEAA